MEGEIQSLPVDEDAIPKVGQYVSADAGGGGDEPASCRFDGRVPRRAPGPTNLYRSEMRFGLRCLRVFVD